MRRSNGLLGLIGLILLVVRRRRRRADARRRPSSTWSTSPCTAVAGVLALIAYLSAGLENLRDVPRRALDQVRHQHGARVADLHRHPRHRQLPRLSPQPPLRSHLGEASSACRRSRCRCSPASTKDLRMEAFVEGGVNPELDDLLKNYAASSQQGELPARSIRTASRSWRSDTASRPTTPCASQYGDASNQVTQPTEETLTNAIIKLTRSGRQTVCVIEGHGEPDIDDKEGPHGLSQAKAALENENYEVKKVLLASMEKVPDECNVVLVAGPTRPFLSQELPAARRLPEGGRPRPLPAVAAARRRARRLPRAVGRQGRQRRRRRPGRAPLPGARRSAWRRSSTPTTRAHEITKELKGRTLFPMTRSVSATPSGKPGIKAVELVKTSASSWAEVDIDGIFQRQQATLDGADRKGPVPIAVAVDADLKLMGGAGRQGGAPGGVRQHRVRRQPHLEGTYFNRDLFLNTVGWLVGAVGPAVDPPALGARLARELQPSARARRSSTCRSWCCPSCCSSPAWPSGGGASSRVPRPCAERSAHALPQHADPRPAAARARRLSLLRRVEADRRRKQRRRSSSISTPTTSPRSPSSIPTARSRSRRATRAGGSPSRSQAAADDVTVKNLMRAIADAEVKKTIDEPPQDLAPFGLAPPKVVGEDRAKGRSRCPTSRSARPPR